MFRLQESDATSGAPEVVFRDRGFLRSGAVDGNATINQSVFRVDAKTVIWSEVGAKSPGKRPPIQVVLRRMVVEHSFGKTASVIIAGANEEQVVHWKLNLINGGSLDGSLICLSFAAAIPAQKLPCVIQFHLAQRTLLVTQIALLKHGCRLNANQGHTNIIGFHHCLFMLIHDCRQYGGTLHAPSFFSRSREIAGLSNSFGLAIKLQALRHVERCSRSQTRTETDATAPETTRHQANSPRGKKHDATGDASIATASPS